MFAATGKTVMTREELYNLCDANNMTRPQWFFNNPENRARYGQYKLPEDYATVVQNIVSLKQAEVKAEPVVEVIANKPITISSVDNTQYVNNLVPEVYKNYVPFGHFNDLVDIIKSEIFYPIFITGHSGNGKTMSVEQACAKLGRKFVLVSMTPDTDEGDLLGNYVLIDGQMIWRDGPVTIAAREGAVLCIDEIDYGAQNLSALQRVLEGKSFLLKKKNETVTPAKGFTVVATANTKGKGSEDGRYMFTNILNEAFLERFLNTYEQDWPEVAIEKKIIRKELKQFGAADDAFANFLVDWADLIRKTFNEGGVDEVISTRRLVFISKTYSVFKDRLKAVKLCLNRFDEETKVTFLDLYTKLDVSVLPQEPPPIFAAQSLQDEDVEIPF